MTDAAAAPVRAEGSRGVAGIAWWRIATKDLRVEVRGRELLGVSFLTGVMAVAAGAVAFSQAADRVSAAAATFWIAVLFGATLLMGRSYVAEVDRGTMTNLLLLPVDRGTLYLGKAVANGIVVGVLSVFLGIIVTLFFGISWAADAGAAFVLVGLAAVGIAGAGTFLASIAARTRAREAMLPVLFLPVAFPILLAAIPATQDLLRGGSLDLVQSRAMLLGGYDVAVIALSWVLYEFVVEA
ncbi:MAG: heme exporter protein CcmB [Thermoplasmatota archaeon]